MSSESNNNNKQRIDFIESIIDTCFFCENKYILHYVQENGIMVNYEIIREKFDIYSIYVFTNDYLIDLKFYYNRAKKIFFLNK